MVSRDLAHRVKIKLRFSLRNVKDSILLSKRRTVKLEPSVDRCKSTKKT